MCVCVFVCVCMQVVAARNIDEFFGDLRAHKRQRLENAEGVPPGRCHWQTLTPVGYLLLFVCLFVQHTHRLCIILCLVMHSVFSCTCNILTNLVWHDRSRVMMWYLHLVRKLTVDFLYEETSKCSHSNKCNQIRLDYEYALNITYHLVFPTVTMVTELLVTCENTYNYTDSFGECVSSLVSSCTDSTSFVSPSCKQFYGNYLGQKFLRR